jgi:hypothetical protein
MQLAIDRGRKRSLEVMWRGFWDAKCGFGKSSHDIAVVTMIQLLDYYPADVALGDLSPVPEALAAKFPEPRGDAFMRSSGKLLIIDAANRLVIGVLPAQ